MVSDRYGKGARLPLCGMLGESLLPLFEREGRKSIASPKLKHFLAIGSHIDASIQQDNPIADVIPKEFHSFREVLQQG